MRQGHLNDALPSSGGGEGMLGVPRDEHHDVREDQPFFSMGGRPPGCLGPLPPSPSATCAMAGGIADPSLTVCCARECGSCGGSECGKRPGGHASCCTNAIEAAGVACTEGAVVGKAPCTLSLSLD